MIYLDSSVVLSRILAEPRTPPDEFWAQPFVSSRLLAYEVFNRILASTRDALRIQTAEKITNRIEFLDLSPAILARALEPFPMPVRTLDSLHLATMDFLRARGLTIELASYDQRLNAAALALGFALFSV